MKSVKATLHLPEEGQSVTRRFLADDDVMSGYSALASKLTQLFPELSKDKFTIHWLDSEGDLIVASTDEEIFIAMSSLPSEATLNIVIEVKDDAHNKEEIVLCRGCGATIIGHQYKCVVCPNYDLCAPCEQRGKHSHHPVVRVTTQEQPSYPRPRTRLADMGCHRYSPYFEEGATRQGLFDRPCGGSRFFHCHNPSAFEEFNQMANNLIKNWCMAMPPPKSKHFTNGNKTDSKETHTNSGKSTDSVPRKYEKSDEFDPELFKEMVEEMTESFNETMKNIGEKQNLENKKLPQEDEVREKQHTEGDVGFDLRQMSHMLTPMMKSFVEAMGGDYEENDQDTCWTKGDMGDKKQGKCEDKKRHKRPMTVVSESENSSWSSHEGSRGSFQERAEQTKPPFGECQKQTTPPSGECKKQTIPPSNGCAKQATPTFGECNEKKSTSGNCTKQTTPFGECKKQTTSPSGDCAKQITPTFGECNEKKSTFGQSTKQTTTPFGECKKQTTSPSGDCMKQKTPLYGVPQGGNAPTERKKQWKDPRPGLSKRLEGSVPGSCPNPAAGHCGQDNGGVSQVGKAPDMRKDPWKNPRPGTSKESDGSVPSLCPNPAAGHCGQENGDMTRALVQLRSMGFTEEVGRLIALLRAEGGDVRRVIDRILPAQT